MNKKLFLTGEEMFPELANKENKMRYFDFIAVDELKEFVKECYKYAEIDIDAANFEYENKVAEILIDHLIRRGLLDTNSHQNFIDVLLVSVFLHYIYFDEDEIIPTLMSTRYHFEELAEKYMPEQVSEAIFDTIEGQLGDATPVKTLKPKPNSPGELFAECVFIARSLYKWKQ